VECVDTVQDLKKLVEYAENNRCEPHILCACAPRKSKCELSQGLRFGVCFLRILKLCSPMFEFNYARVVAV